MKVATLNVPQIQDHSLASARTLMDDFYHLPLDLGQISSQTGFSRYYFIRAFRRAFGVTPHQYLTQRRIEKAKILLASSELPVTEICFAVGFQSLGSFSELFRRHVGHSPRAHRCHALEQKRHLRRAAPGCLLAMFGDDDAHPAIEQFSRSRY